MPAGATAKEFQQALAAYAAKSGQAYTVDSAAFDPTNPVKPRQSMALADIPPDVPTEFSYLDVDTCRKKPEGKFDIPTSSVGKIVNHYQWCGWNDMKLTFHMRDPRTGALVPQAKVYYRATFIGWGSSKSSKVWTDIYVDEIRPFGGVSGLTPQNTTLSFLPFCEDIFAGGTCDTTGSLTSATVAELQAGKVLHVSNVVTLADKTAANPDRVTAFSHAISLQGTSTAFPGQVGNAGAVKPLVRCDAATDTGRGGFSTPACIYAGVLPGYELRVSDAEVGEVALHVQKALTDPNSTDPQLGRHKNIPAVLHRTVDKTIIAANRAIGTSPCPSPRPEGMQCDEYPFASSREGGANRDYFGTNWDYSSKLVTKEVNEAEGRRRYAWYKADRYLDGDAFTVSVSN